MERGAVEKRSHAARSCRGEKPWSEELSSRGAVERGVVEERTVERRAVSEEPWREEPSRRAAVERGAVSEVPLGDELLRKTLDPAGLEGQEGR